MSPSHRLPEGAAQTALTADPYLDGHRRGPARRSAVARSPVEGQHRRRRLGRHRLPLQTEQGAPGGQRLPIPHSLQEAARYADGEESRPRQRSEVEGPRRCRARLRPLKGGDGTRCAHHRLAPSRRENRASQPRLQHETGGLARRLPNEDGLRIRSEAIRPGSGWRCSSRQIHYAPKLPAHPSRNCRQTGFWRCPAGWRSARGGGQRARRTGRVGRSPRRGAPYACVVQSRSRRTEVITSTRSAKGGSFEITIGSVISTQIHERETLSANFQGYVSGRASSFHVGSFSTLLTLPST